MSGDSGPSEAFTCWHADGVRIIGADGVGTISAHSLAINNPHGAGILSSADRVGIVPLAVGVVHVGHRAPLWWFDASSSANGGCLEIVTPKQYSVTVLGGSHLP